MIRPFYAHDAYPRNLLHRAVRSALEACGNGGSLLDFGCGEQPYRALAAAAGYRYTGADREGAGSADVRFAPGGALPLADASFDVVLSTQVLEHAAETGAYLRECRRVLKPGGRLVLSTHGVWPYHPTPGDFRRWTREGLVYDLKAGGFEPLTIVPLVGPLAWATLFRLFAWRELFKNAGPLAGPLTGAAAAAANLRMALEDRLTPAAVLDVHAAVYLTVSKKASER